jgi:hypothetical protein
MTVPLEVVSEATCSQLFTEQYGKFILGNDTVTAFDPDWDPLKSPDKILTAKSGQPGRRKPAGRSNSESCGGDSPDKNLAGD